MLWCKAGKHYFSYVIHFLPMRLWSLCCEIDCYTSPQLGETILTPCLALVMFLLPVVGDIFLKGMKKLCDLWKPPKTCETLNTALNKASYSCWRRCDQWCCGVCFLGYWLGSWQARISARRHKLPFQLWGRMRMYRATTGVENWLITGVSLSTFP